MKPRLIAATIVVVATAGCASEGGNDVSPEDSEAPAEDFVSERHEYALTFPDGTWTIAESPGTWEPGTAWGNESPGVDRAIPAGETSPPVIIFTSQLVESDADQDAWFEAYDAATADAFQDCELKRTEPGELGGEPARIASYVCAGITDAMEAIAFHGDRVYGLRVFGDGAYDPEPMFELWLDAFRFTD